MSETKEITQSSMERSGCLEKNSASKLTSKAEVRVSKPPRRKLSRISDREVVEAIVKAGGFVSVAARSLGVTRAALSARIHSSQTLAQELEGTRESLLDIAEYQLISAIKSGHLTAIMYFLNNRGKSRGYNRREEKDDQALETLGPVAYLPVPVENWTTKATESQADLLRRHQ